MRRKIVAGNWKMYTSKSTATQLAHAVATQSASVSGVEVIVCPPFCWLTTVSIALGSAKVGLGAQNVYPANEGAFTGEVSPTMLRDAGCQYVILGHSERRHGMGETDDFINKKVHAALDAGLSVIFCIGETLEEREGNHTESVLIRQITHGLAGVKVEQLGKLIIAYEPVWAIGTGKTATPQQAQDAHAHIRAEFGAMFTEAAAGQVSILYGGSVKPDNAAELMSQPDVDGALVGGASLKADTFLPIVQAAQP